MSTGRALRRMVDPLLTIRTAARHLDETGQGNESVEAIRKAAAKLNRQLVELRLRYPG